MAAVCRFPSGFRSAHSLRPLWRRLGRIGGRTVLVSVQALAGRIVLEFFFELE